MAKVLSVNPDTKGKKYHIDVCDGCKRISYTVGSEAYADIGFPSEEDELDEYAMGVIRFENEYNLALKAGYRLLGTRDRSRRELITKLTDAGYSIEASERAVLRLSELGYIDEDDQLERAILREANVSLRGPRLITERLRIKGYDSYDVRRVMEKLVDEGSIDFEANFERLVSKKRASDDKRYILKYRYGYEF